MGVDKLFRLHFFQETGSSVHHGNPFTDMGSILEIQFNLRSKPCSKREDTSKKIALDCCPTRYDYFDGLVSLHLLQQHVQHDHQHHHPSEILDRVSLCDCVQPEQDQVH